VLKTPRQNKEYMKNVERLVQWSRGAFISALAAFLLVGCKTNSVQPCTKTTVTTTTVPVVVAPAPAVAAPAPAAPAAPIPAGSAIRIDAGATAPYTDSSGNVWLADQGFEGGDGDVVEHGDDMQIANTKDPVIYRTERWGMSSFSYKLPNGKYTVKLHFAETYDGITGPGERVFSFNVAGHEFKDFDVWVKAGGPQRAYVETVNVEVTDGKLGITFTPNVQNPQINGIEIIPGS
jgi:hypothetical protein